MKQREILWYGYRHTDGGLNLRRYFGSHDTAEARSSPFVNAVFGPFSAATYGEAQAKLKALASRTAGK